MSIKYYWMGLAVVLLAGVCTACSDHDEEEQSNVISLDGIKTNDPVILDELELSFEELAEALYGKDQGGLNGPGSSDEMEQLYAEMRAAMESDVLQAVKEDGGLNGSNGSTDEWTCDTINMSYTTVDGSGHSIRLSRRLSLPRITGEYVDIKGVLLNCHPTSVGQIVPLCSLKARTADGLAVIEPDYIGFGISANKPQTYLCQKLIARQCVDMIPAALKLMQQRGVTMEKGWGTYVVGYSQGGGNALAVGRHIEVEADENLRKLINLKKVMCGAGPYDPMATFNYWLEHDRLSMSLVLPMVVKGMMEGHPDIMKGIKLKEYFSEAYISTGVIDEVDNNTLNMKRMMTLDTEPALADANLGLSGIGLYWMQFSKIMSATCADPNSHIRQALEQCLKAEIVNDWKPSVPVEIYSAPNDNVIPFTVNAQSTYDKLKAAGADVKLTLGATTFDHITGQVYWMRLINIMKAYK